MTELHLVTGNDPVLNFNDSKNEQHECDETEINKENVNVFNDEVKKDVVMNDVF